MKIIHQQITLETAAPIAVIDITAQVRELCRATCMRDGLVTLISPHTTAHINLNEHEPALQQDMLDFLSRFVPRAGDYRHNRHPVDGRDNAHSHLMGLFMNATETIPIVNGDLMLGGWQSIFFIELDGPRVQRRVLLQFIGTDSGGT
jgi:secondary thiamine-phosphate synthase enzyme